MRAGNVLRRVAHLGQARGEGVEFLLVAELGNDEAPEWREKVEVEMTVDEVSEARERAADWLKRREKL